jgi:hypothetical protein
MCVRQDTLLFYFHLSRTSNWLSTKEGCRLIVNEIRLQMGADLRSVQLTIRRMISAVLLASAASLAVFPASAQSINLPLLPGIELDLPQPLSNAVVPILTNLQLPGNIVDTIDTLCPSLPLSSECSALLQAVSVQAPTAQQLIANASAAAIVQTNLQVADFALSGGLLPPTQSPAVLQSLSPTVTTFGISGVSHTSHDGFQIEGPIGGRTLGFDSLDVGVTLGFRVDASKAINLPADTLTLGFFGNYTNSDIDVDSSKALRQLGLTNVGDATLNNGSAGGYLLLTNGAFYGLGLASGEFGEARVDDGPFQSSNFDTSGFASSLLGGALLSLGPLTKIDFRGGLNYLTANAESHVGFGDLRFSDGEIDQFSGAFSARLFATWEYGRTVVRPFVQGGVDYRFHYDNHVEIEGVKFSFDEGLATVFGRAGVDFDIGNRSQLYFAVRADHNEDFDTVAGQAGLTIRLN